MTNSDLPAMPVPGLQDDSDFNGLTKREYFAGLAMQGLLTNPAQLETDVANQSALAVEHADALLTELEKAQ